MTWQSKVSVARTEGELAAERLIDRLGIRHDLPVDVFGIIESFDIILCYQGLGNILGVYLAGPPPGILINSKFPVSVQRLTAAHELGHHQLGHAGSIDDPINLRSVPLKAAPQSRRLPLSVFLKEIAAQSFAVSFIAPAANVRATMERLGLRGKRLLTPEDAYTLSLHLGLSYEATVHRLRALHELPQDDPQEWFKNQPARAKVSLNGGRKLESGKVDVWRADRTSPRSLFGMSVGDLLSVSLPEIPSSGYRWRETHSCPAVACIGQTFSLHKSEVDTAGGSGERVFRYRVESAGEHRLEYQCARSWISSSPIDQFGLFIDAQRPPGLLTETERKGRLESNDFIASPAWKRSILASSGASGEGQ